MTEPTAPIETNPPASSSSPPSLYTQPRITIQYCTQCKWMLRAAYFAQELLSTFSTDLGEVALVPRTGGVFTVTIFPSSVLGPSKDLNEGGKVLWDRKTDGGFPEVKELKSRVRNVIDPSRDLGHTDRALKKGKDAAPVPESSTIKTPETVSGNRECEDCK
ncbi:Rdx family-domain-containing protein [Aspergillus unguis]